MIVTCRMEIANAVYVRQLSVIQEYVIDTYRGGFTKGLDYAFVVGLGWCTLSRDTKDLTVSLTQMAKIIEINMVPMEMPPYLTIKIPVLCERSQPF